MKPIAAIGDRPIVGDDIIDAAALAAGDRARVIALARRFLDLQTRSNP